VLDVAGLYERYERQIWVYLARRVHSSDRDSVDDLAQETWLKAFRFAPSYVERGMPVSAWLYRIAYTVLVDHSRHRASNRGDRRNVSLDLVRPQAESVPDPVGEAGGTIDLTPYLAWLTDVQRQVVTARFYDGCSVKETSELVGRTEEAVKKLQARGLENMRRAMERSAAA
jgi:RNA polymerase sigma-70 factor (ECF subfamily)